MFKYAEQVTRLEEAGHLRPYTILVAKLRGKTLIWEEIRKSEHNEMDLEKCDWSRSGMDPTIEVEEHDFIM